MLTTASNHSNKYGIFGTVAVGLQYLFVASEECMLPCFRPPGVRNFKVQRTSIGMAGGASIKQKILQWCRNKTQTYEVSYG